MDRERGLLFAKQPPRLTAHQVTSAWPVALSLIGPLKVRRAAGGAKVKRAKKCPFPRPYFYRRRNRTGREQETKSPSQQPAGSGRRSAQRAAFQSIQSLTHGRWQPWLQSEPHDLEVKPAPQMPMTYCSPVAHILAPAGRGAFMA